MIRRANSHWYMRTARSNARSRRRNVRGDEIWKVRDHRIEGGPLDLQGVPRNHLDRRELPLEESCEASVRLDGDDTLRAFREGTGQDAEPGTDLEYRVRRTNTCVGHMAIRDAGIDEEVLAQALPGSDSQAREDVSRRLVHGGRTDPIRLRFAVGIVRG